MLFMGMIITYYKEAEGCVVGIYRRDAFFTEDDANFKLHTTEH